MRGIDTLEQLADVKAVVVEAVPRDGFAVLNADDALVRRMRRRCSGGGRLVLACEEPGSRVREFIDDHCRRGGRAVVLDRTERGDMIVIRHGRRSMQLAWTHLLPSTFGGTARFNVANAMAAAGAAFAAGAGLHEIRQGLRTFTTSYYLSPGRMNQVNVHNVDVFVDYCHNAPGMRVLGEFVERYAAQKAGQTDLGKISRIGMIATAGDRRDDDMRELGCRRRPALRRGRRARGRAAAWARARRDRRALVAEGARRPDRQARRALPAGRDRARRDRRGAARMARANPGDIVVLCVDQHATVLSRAGAMTQHAQAGRAHRRLGVGDPDLDPGTLQEEAREAGDRPPPASLEPIERLGQLTGREPDGSDVTQQYPRAVRRAACRSASVAQLARRTPCSAGGSARTSSSPCWSPRPR